MKKKSLLLTALALFGITSATMAQVPSYVPTNGLVGWWPFNGNANDESGNGNNGTVNGANLTTDRLGSSNKAYTFDGNDFISVNHNTLFNMGSNFTISLWFTVNNFNNVRTLVNKNVSGNGNLDYFNIGILPSSGTLYTQFGDGNLIDNIVCPIIPSLNIWYNATFSVSDSVKFFLNGQLVESHIRTITPLENSNNISFGYWQTQSHTYHNGKLDDIGIWNRALTQQEITALYNGVNCANNTTITPQIISLSIGGTATFTATTSDPNPNYIWQSNFGQGFQTLNNFGNYTGANTATLNIANVQLANHNQPLRVISTSGNCVDTSNVAIINIIDTCLISVTDTLIINASLTNTAPPNNQNTIKVYPNPASTHITIDYGNFGLMNGYTLTIVNATGQTVFTTPINQQISVINLSTWTGNGIYFVRLTDQQNNLIENRKIVIQ